MENGFFNDYPCEPRSMKSEIKSLRLSGHCGMIDPVHQLYFDEYNLCQLQHLHIGGIAFLYCQYIVFTSGNLHMIK